MWAVVVTKQYNWGHKNFAVVYNVSTNMTVNNSTVTTKSVLRVKMERDEKTGNITLKSARTPDGIEHLPGHKTKGHKGKWDKKISADKKRLFKTFKTTIEQFAGGKHWDKFEPIEF